jgi:hypothetical protein
MIITLDLSHSLVIYSKKQIGQIERASRISNSIVSQFREKVMENDLKNMYVCFGK